MKTTVVKFGGSSLASAEQFRKVAAIILSDSSRRYVVASAPGKRNSEDIKVTDLLYRCCELACAKQDFAPVLAQIKDRFSAIIEELNISFDIDSEIEKIRGHLSAGPQKDYMASRGEYLNSKILAAFLGFAFVDPADHVRFTDSGILDAETTNDNLSKALAPLEHAVVPGFYGALADGTIRTFSRGGSDVTGSIVARAAKADLYENWTDVSGMLAADPRIVENPHTIDYITYKELRELSYMGASVLHEDAVFPVRKARIPINIRNTNRPEDAGTMIVPKLPENYVPRKVTGIAGHSGFSSVLVEKALMNGEVGFAYRLLQIFANHGISIEHCPTGIDTMSIIMSSEQFTNRRDEILQDIKYELDPDILVVEEDLALIAVVGHGMANSRGVAARIFQAVAKAGINIRMIDQGSSELNIIIGVRSADYAAAIRSIYAEVEDVL